MSYEMLRLAQLVFALSLMFGAFLGGIAVGWWRWGRSSTRAKMSQRLTADAPPHPTGLFTPAGFSDEEIVLQPIFDVAAHDLKYQLRGADSANLRFDRKA